MNAAKHSIRLTAVAVMLIGSLSPGIAADDILWTWDNAIDGWGNAWGQAVAQFDASEDNTGNNGGSLYISTDYSGSPPDENRNVVTIMGNYSGGLWNSQVQNNLVEYESLEFDIKWDAEATISVNDFNTAGGNNGLVIWSARHDGNDWQWIDIDTILIPDEAANGWAHVSIPIDSTTANLDRSAGIVLKKWVPQDVADASGIAAFWVDNLELSARDLPLEPPTLSLSSDVSTGLNLITIAGNQWQRQGIRTVGENFSWVGTPTPTTYEYTVKEMPEAAYAGFTTLIFLVANDPRTRVDPDWAHPDAIRFDMSQQGDGSYLGTFRYKINTPDSNGGMFGGDGELGSVTSSTAIGRWGMTFNDRTSITIFSPEATADIVFPDAAVAEFDAPMTVYFGCMPSAPERIGQKVVFEQVKIQDAVGGVDVLDDFTGQLNTTAWELAAQYPEGVMIPTDAAFWLGWTLPDSGFRLEVASQFEPADWTPFAGAMTPLLTGPTKSALIGESELPDGQAGYWRLRQREFSKLQILLPGETAAPGSPTGKTGVPDPQTQFIPFVVTVNAVDDDWVVMTEVSDTVTLSSTDPDSLLPPDTELVNGTIALEVDLGSIGTGTITVSNVTNSEIQSDRSSGVVIDTP